MLSVGSTSQSGCSGGERLWGRGCHTLRCPARVSTQAHPTGARWKHTSEMLQQLDLAQGSLGQDLLAEDIGDLLDCDALARLVVRGRTARASRQHCPRQARRAAAQGILPDNAVSSLPQLLCDIVPLVDDKFLVEDLEDLAAL